MSEPKVYKLSFDPALTAKNGNINIDRRTQATGFKDLSAGLVEFEDSGISDSWTLPYEEAFYVIDGEVTIHVGDDEISAKAGEILALDKGVTVRYEGAAGSRAFFCLVPANWMESLQG